MKRAANKQNVKPLPRPQPNDPPSKSVYQMDAEAHPTPEMIRQTREALLIYFASKQDPKHPLKKSELEAKVRKQMAFLHPSLKKVA